METIDPSIFSAVFDETIEILAYIPAFTNDAGDKIPAQYITSTTATGNLQDITNESANQTGAGIYHAGDMHLYTSADIRPIDRVKISGDIWQVSARIARSRMLAPGRNQYIVRRVTTNL